MTKQKFYLLSWTWGLPLTLVGLLISIVLRALGYEPKKWGGATYFVVGSGWGAFSIGTTVVVSKEMETDATLNHEFGHSIQNCYFGFLCPFIVSIPSFIRACYREMVVKLKVKKYSELPDYDSIWFEGQATELGTANIEHWRL